MFTKNIKKLIFTFIAVNLLISNSSPLPVSQAKAITVDRPICSLAVAPYNPAGKALTNPDDGNYIFDKYLNVLSTDICNSFVKLYGNEYAPQPPKSENNPLTQLAIDDKVSVPIIQHDHAYYNSTGVDNYYYKSFVKKFVITLQEDTTKNIDLNNIKCDTAIPTNSDPAINNQLKFQKKSFIFQRCCLKRIC